LVDNALTPGTGGRKRYTLLDVISPEQARQIKADTGLDLAGIRQGNPELARSMARNGAINPAQLEATRRQANAPASAATPAKKQMLSSEELMAGAGK
jgi:hypothetical protein